MRRQRLQNKVAASKLSTLAAVLVYAFIWWSNKEYSTDSIVGASACLLTAYIWMEASISHQLLRIRSLFIPTFFILASTFCKEMQSLSMGLWIVVCFTMCCYFIFNSYQNNRETKSIFHGFMLLALASFGEVKILWLIPFIFIGCLVYLRSLSFKTFSAALIGIIGPYWLYLCYCLYINQIDVFIQHFQDLLCPPDLYQALTTTHPPIHTEQFTSALKEIYTLRPTAQTLGVGYYTFLALVSSIHCEHTRSNDKIRTRMFFHFFILMEVFGAAMLLLYPHETSIWIPLFLCTASPLVGHFFALSNSRITTVFFIFTIIIFIGIWTFDLWRQLFNI